MAEPCKYCAKTGYYHQGECKDVGTVVTKPANQEKLLSILEQLQPNGSTLVDNGVSILDATKQISDLIREAEKQAVDKTLAELSRRGYIHLKLPKEEFAKRLKELTENDPTEER